MATSAVTVQAGPGTGETEDAELVRRVRRGDDGAFEKLYHRYHRRITAYIHGMVHDHGRAEDVAQDVFVSALRRMRETDRPIAFKPWIYEIAKNACIDQFRRSRRAEEVSYDAEEGLGAADYGRLVSADAMPENELESKTNLDHLRGAFGGLSETHHEILVMRELEGLSYREIGERLGMSRPSVESTLFRARRRLTEEYEELVSGARCQRIQAIIAGAVAGDVGTRDQRRLARHVSHCQPCRRQARLAGLDVPVTAEHPLRQRIAAMLPLPLFLRRRWIGLDDGGAVGGGSSNLGGFAPWSAQLGATMDPSWAKAAMTAAVVAVAGTGAGLAGRPDTASPATAGIAGVVAALGDDEDATVDRQAAAPAGSRTVLRSATSLSTADAAATAAAPAGAASSPAAAAPGSASSSAAGSPSSAAPGVDGSAGQLASAGGNAVGGAGSTAQQAAGRAPSAGSAPKVDVPKVDVPDVSVSAPPALDPATAAQEAQDAAGDTAGQADTAASGATGQAGDAASGAIGNSGAATGAHGQ